MVDPGRVILGTTSRFVNFEFPYSREDDFNKLINSQRRMVDTIVNRSGHEDEILFQLRDKFNKIKDYLDYTTLSRIEPICSLIREELEAGAYNKVVIFARRMDTIEHTRLYMKPFYPMTRYPNSNPFRIEKNLKKFADPDSKFQVLIQDINACKLETDLSFITHAFFVEESFDIKDNVTAVKLLQNNNDSDKIFIRNVCLTDPLDQRIQEIMRDRIKARSTQPELRTLYDLF